jgi:acyl carrier protein
MEVKEEVRRYVAENFLPAAQNSTLLDDTPLISSGLIDSIGMIGLVAFIERRCGIEFHPREVEADKLDTLARIDALVQKKQRESLATGLR